MFKKILNILRQVAEVYIREFKIVLHDPGVLLFMLFLPMAYPVIYSLIYNKELVRDVRMVVVDHDRTSESRELVRRLDATQETWVTGYASNLTEAKHAMDNHDCYAILEIPSGFGRKLGLGEASNAVLYCDMSLLLRYRGFVVATVGVSQAMGTELLHKKMVYEVPAVASIAEGMGDPMPVKSIMMGNTQSGFDSFLMPGVLILILHQCIILAVGMLGGAKRERCLTGYNQPPVVISMLGQMLCYMTALLIPMIFLIHYIPLIFAFPMAGNAFEIFTFLLPMFIACVMLGFCLQSVVWERETIFLIWVVTSVVMIFLTGLTWPRYAIDGVWRVLSDILPATWGVEGFLKMQENGSSLAQVGNCYRNLWILAGSYAVLAYILQRWVFRPTELHPSNT